ncbi:hypothetical protein Neosp_013958 [[Neocosmospora] mangrovei]
MENVFAYAHCTLAATSAEDCNQGFLSRSAESFVKLTDPDSNPALSFYIKETENNFDKDVAQGLLNKRAWVFQERVLSRRTIHFTAQQTYFESRSNIWCEAMDPERSAGEDDEDIRLTNAGSLAPIQESGFLLIAPLYQVTGSPIIEPDGSSNCKMMAGNKFLGWLRYDGEDKKSGMNLLCIRVSRIDIKKEDNLSSGELIQSAFATVMIVNPMQRGGRHVYKTYQRLGVGIIREESLVRDEQGLVWVA